MYLFLVLFISSCRYGFYLLSLIFNLEKFYLALLLMYFFYAGENSPTFHFSYNILISPFLEGIFATYRILA